MLAVAELVAAKDIDGAMLGGGHQPGAGIVGDAGGGPLLERRHQRVLGQFLGEADIAHHAGETGDELGLLDPEDCLDGAMGVGRRHGDRLWPDRWPPQAGHWGFTSPREPPGTCRSQSSGKGNRGTSRA